MKLLHQCTCLWPSIFFAKKTISSHPTVHCTAQFSGLKNQALCLVMLPCAVEPVEVVDFYRYRMGILEAAFEQFKTNLFEEILFDVHM